MKNILYIGNHLQSPGSLPTGIHTLSGNLRQEGYGVITASGRQGKLWRLAEMLQSVYQNRRWAEVVLIDTYSTRNFWYAYAIAKLCQRLGLRYIPILHGGELPRRLKENPEACELIFGRAYVNVAPSRYLMERFSLRRRGAEKEENLKMEDLPSSTEETLRIVSPPPTPVREWNLTYIPNSLDLSQYEFRKRTDLRPRLLWVRAFAEIYNPMLALQALELLRRKYPQAELCMVGPKKDASYEECREYAQQQDLRVKFTGMLEKSEWTRLADGYDIFINTSNIDNTPISVLEAMALGLPVISTDVGGMPYLITDESDGVLIRPDDVEVLAQALVRLLENPERGTALSLAARKKVEGFSWSEVRHKWAEVLRY